MKFGRDQKVELKKYFGLYRQTLLEVLMKVGIILFHFALTKMSEMKAKVHIKLKKPFFLPTIQIEKCQ